MGERDLAQSALGMLVEHARFDAGLRQPVQEQMRLRQIRRGAQPEHGYLSILHAEADLDLDLPVRDFAVHEMAAGLGYFEPV